MSEKAKFSHQINNLISEYEKKAECGIFFKLNPNGSPLDIIGVLDFLKYKVKKWQNSNIYTYFGNLFDNHTILVVGARNLSEAESIMIYMYLSQFVVNNLELDDLLRRIDSSTDLEQYLKSEISKNIKKGYPKNLKFELELKNHLDGLIKS